MSPLLLRRLSDRSLGRRLAAGEAAAFDELYRRYAHRLAAYGAYLLGDAASGEDVAQSALLKAYGALREGRTPEQVRPWLYRIAHNTALDLVARRRELPASELPERAAPPPGPSTGALVAAVTALPDGQRQVYVLRELHGLRIDETAQELGLSAAQVEQALFAARNRLAEHLVFGDRLNCVAVRRLAAGPLDAAERRALKTHLRSCPECRRTVGAIDRRSGALPGDWLGWLRALPGLIAGSGAPAAVKVGAVVATATLAASAPVGYEIAKDQNPRHPRAAAASVPVPARPASERRVVRARPAVVRTRLVAAVRRPPVLVAVRRAPVPAVVRPRATRRASSERRSRDDSAPAVPAVIPAQGKSDGATRPDDGRDRQPAVSAAVAPVASTSSRLTRTTGGGTSSASGDRRPDDGGSHDGGGSGSDGSGD